MPIYPCNNVASQDTYVDGTTVLFPTLRPTFAMNIVNAAILYQLLLPGVPGKAGQYQAEPYEHALLPSLTTFDSPANEGYDSATYAGIRFRSGTAGKPAIVTVI